MDFGFDSSCPDTADSFSSLSEDFHIIVFDGGFRCHGFILQPQPYNDSELVLNGKPFGYFSSDADSQRWVVAVNRTDFDRQRERGCTADAEPCFDFIFQSVKSGANKCFVSVNL